MRIALLVVAIVTALATGWAPALTPAADGAADDVMSIEIQVSPSVVAFDSQGIWVTVHADIDYAQVVSLSVTLNDIPVVFTKADDRGDLVAKFALDDVKAILEPGTVELKLCGTTVTNVPFEGVDSIRVLAARR